MKRVDRESQKSFGKEFATKGLNGFLSKSILDRPSLRKVVFAAMEATKEASETAKHAGIPLVFSKQGVLYERAPDGSEKVLLTQPNIRKRIRRFYKLK